MLRSVTPMENRIRTVQPGQVKFGSPVEQALTKGLTRLEKHPLAELVVKDIAAFNIPKIALARTWKERIDTATLELSNTGVTLVASLLLPPLIRPLVHKLGNVAESQLKKEFSQVAPELGRKLPVQLARMGSAFGFLFPFASAFWAAPFFRNWLTIQRTHSANFESMIGFDDLKDNKPRRSSEEEMAYQGKTALKILGTGLGLGVASIFGFGLLAKGMANKPGKLLTPLKNKLEGGWKSGFDKLFDSMDLKGPASNEIKGRTAQLLFWGAPAYLGWLHGARSGNERRERAIQSANAIFWFFFASRLTTPVWKQIYQKTLKGEPLEKATEILKKNNPLKEGETPVSKLLNLEYKDINAHFKDQAALTKKLFRLKNAKTLLNDLGIPIGSLSVVQFTNFHLTEKKIKEAQGGQPPSTMPSAPPKPQPGFSSSSAVGQSQAFTWPMNPALPTQNFYAWHTWTPPVPPSFSREMATRSAGLQ